MTDSDDSLDAFGLAVAGARSSVAPTGMSTRVVAVDGPGGAGKSTFAARLATALGEVQIIHTDDFAAWDNPVDWWPALLDQALIPLSRGESCTYQPTTWGDDVRPSVTIRPDEFVVLEGVTASRRAFRPYIAYTIWIDTPRDLRLQRGLERDGEGALGPWERWMTAEDAFIADERPLEQVDLIVKGT